MSRSGADPPPVPGSSLRFRRICTRTLSCVGKVDSGIPAHADPHYTRRARRADLDDIYLECCTQQPLSAIVTRSAVSGENHGLMPRLPRLYNTCRPPVAAWKIYLFAKETDADVSKRSLPSQPSWGTGAMPANPALRRGEHRTESHRAVSRSGARQASRRSALVREANRGEASDADGQFLSATPSPWDLLP